VKPRSHLFRKYAVLFITLVSGALLASGLLDLYFSYRENKAALVRLQRQEAEAAASRIDQFIRAIEAQVGWTTQALFVPQGTPLDRRILDSLLRQAPSITEASYLDAAGREQLRISRLEMDAVGSQVDYSTESKFLEAKSGKTFFGPVYFREESEPYMTIAMSGKGQDAGVTVAEVNLKFIWDVVSRIKIGKAGYAYALDSRGNLIAHPDISLVLKKTSLASLPQVRDAMTGPPKPGKARDWATIAPNLQGRSVLTAHATIIPLGWLVFVEQPLAEAFAPLYASMVRTGILLLVGLGASVMVSLLLARKMVTPIQALQVGAARIGAGALDQRIEVRTGDELEALANQFNSMAAQLRESYANLEQKVEVRTRELSEALEQQTATSEVLKVISRSTFDLQPVLDTLIENAARLCGAQRGQINRLDGEVYRLAAAYNIPPEFKAYLEEHPMRADRWTITGRAALERRTVQIPDVLADAEYEYGEGQHLGGYRTLLAVPMLREGIPIGVIVLWREQVQPFSPRQIELVTTFADQAVIAIENVRLFQELRARTGELARSVEELKALGEVGRAVSSTLDIETVLRTIVIRAVELSGTDGGSVYEYDEAKQEFCLRVTHRIEEELVEMLRAAPLRLGEGAVGQAAVNRAPVQVPDILDEREYALARLRPILTRVGYRSLLAVPLLREERIVGGLVVNRREPGVFSPEAVNLLQTFATQAAIAIENARLHSAAVRRGEEREALLQAAHSVMSGLDLQGILHRIIAEAAQISGCSHVKVMLVDKAAGILQVGALQGTAMSREDRLPLGKGLSGIVAATGQPLISEDCPNDPRNPYADRDRELGILTHLGLPIKSRDEVIGVLSFNTTAPHRYTPDEVAYLASFAAQAGIAIENARLFQELQARNRDLTEALEQQTATAEVLKLISRSTFDLHPVLETLVENATKLCGAERGLIFRRDGEVYRLAVQYGAPPEEWIAFLQRNPISLGRGTLVGRTALEGRTVHIPDVLADPEYQWTESQRLGGFRAILGVPMMREGVPIGVFALWRDEPRPFTDKQIDLVTTFASQAVIAIENVRLFQELQDRNRDLTEALERQTATGEILRVISSSPTDIQPVLDAVAENAARLCDANDAQIFRVDGEVLRLAASYGSMPTRVSRGEGQPISRGWVTGRAVVDRKTIHVHDLAAELETEFPDAKSAQMLSGHRTTLATPLLREGIPIGAILIRRREVRPFSEKQIELVKTFADQAVIAIENVRLFQELQARNRELTEALEQQTATSEILRVISSSPTDIQPVLDAVAENAARVCGATDAAVYRIIGERLQPVASYGRIPASPIIIGRGSVTGRAVVDRQTVHVHDLAVVSKKEFPEGRAFQRETGHRTTLATPLLREGVPVGAILIRRMEVRPFSAKQIQLLETFADQAVIAIENVRLFQELQARTGELARSVEELKALGEIGRAVSSTLDIETVLRTIVIRAVQLSGTDGGSVHEYDEAKQEFCLKVTHRIEEELVEVLRSAPLRLGEGAVGQAAVNRAPVQVPDILDEREYALARLRPILARLGYRALLAVPLLREERIVGGLVLNRREPGAFSAEVVHLLQTFAAQSVLAIENARLFREIEEKGRQLESASKHKSEFLANMSHELRTPLNAILGYTELILDNIYGDVSEKVRDVLIRLEKSGRHLLGLINDVLDLSKIEAGQLTLALADYSMKEVVQTVFTAVESLAAEKHLALKVSVPPDMPLGHGDERRITQVLLNLVGNAIKFTEAGEVRVEVGAPDDTFLVSVADTGPGIAPADQERIFEEFHQVDSSSTRKKGGTGLGLSIAKRIIEMHGGRIWVESSPGRGSTFWFRLPIHVERRAEAP
jgi:GAF domain-containing protein/HAMP domain-containing protein